MIVRTHHEVYGNVGVLQADSAIGQHILEGRVWEPHITLQLDRILPAVDGYCLDIGSHVGLHALYMANHLGKKVIAFEPQPLLFSALVENIVANQASILPMQQIVSNRDGLLNMGIPKSYDEFENPGGLGVVDESFEHPHLIKREFPCTRIDSLNLSKIGCMKIDVEGHEMEVLQGASQTILRDRPILIVELYGGCDRHEYADQIDARIREIDAQYGYFVKYIGGCDYLCIPKNKQ